MAAAATSKADEDPPRKVNVAVMLDPRVDKQLRLYGKDNLSAGVARAAEVALDKFGRVELPATNRRPAPATGVRGRPLTGAMPRKRTNVMMYPALNKLLQVFGGGNVSDGIERAAFAARAVKL